MWKRSPSAISSWSDILYIICLPKMLHDVPSFKFPIYVRFLSNLKATSTSFPSSYITSTLGDCDLCY